MTRPVIARDRLGVLAKIGQGGQGVVYRAPNVKTKFATSMVYKEYKASMRAGVDFSALAAMPALVEDSLTYAQAERLISTAAWPCALVEDDGAPTGFVMPAIPDEFFIDLTTVKGVSRTTAEFQHLLNHSSVLAARGLNITDAQRYTLLREVASTLAFMHKHGVCVGDISPKNLLFALTPHEAAYFIDCDAMRINTVSALPQMETPGWDAPPGEELATIYTDTYKLGLLALRLLAGDHDTKNPHHLPPTTPELLRQIITDTLTNQPHQRPLPEAWTYVLGHAIEHAQHQTKAKAAPAAPVSLAPDPPPIPIVHSRPPTPTPQSRPPAPPPPPPAWAPPAASPSRTPVWVGLGLATVVIAALIVVIAVLATKDNSTPSATPTTTTEASTYSPASEANAQPAPPSLEAPPSTTAPSAGIPGLAPFAREWRGARESVIIDTAGNGHFHYMMDCPTCTTMADMPYNTMDFTLTSVSGDTASGTVTASSDPRFPVGATVAATLGEQDTIHWFVGDKNEGLFCGSNPRWCGG